MTNKRNIGGVAAIGGMSAAVLLLTGLPAAKADELADLRANQQLLQQRIDQLAQVAPGNPYGRGAPNPAATAGATGGSFPRSFLIPGTDTSIRVGGEIREVLDYWFQGGQTNGSQNTTVGDNGNALSQPLDVHGQTVPGFPKAGNLVPVQVNHSRGNGIFQQSPRESKLNVETRTPTAYGEARTFMEFDWAGSNNFSSNQLLSVSDNLVPRLRYAYGTLGGFLAGQANSNFSDSDANPETLDFGGDVGQAGVVRIPQVRYTYAGPWGSAWSMSLETPQTDVLTPGGKVTSDANLGQNPVSLSASGATTTGCVANGTIQPGSVTPVGLLAPAPGTAASMTSTCALPFNIAIAKAPDITFASYWSQPWGHVDFRLVGRELTVNDGKFVDRSFFGYGGGVSGSVNTDWFGWAKDNFVWQFTIGNGIGRYLNESDDAGLATNYIVVPTTSAAASNVLVRTIPEFGASAGYQHWWWPNLRSNVTFGLSREQIPSQLVGPLEVGQRQQAGDDRARQPDLEPGRVCRHRYRIYVGPASGGRQHPRHRAGADRQVRGQILTKTARPNQKQLTTLVARRDPGGPFFFCGCGAKGTSSGETSSGETSSDLGGDLAQHRTQPGESRLAADVALPQAHNLERRRRIGRLEQPQAVPIGKSGSQPARQQRRHLGLADHGERGKKMRRRQADLAPQPACLQRTLQEPDLAAGHQPLQPMIDDIAANRILVLAGRGDDQVREGREPFEGQLLRSGGMIGAERPDLCFPEQRLMAEALGNATKAADRQIRATGEDRLGHAEIARPNSQGRARRFFSEASGKARHQHRPDIFAAHDREPPLGPLRNKFGGAERQLEPLQALAQMRRDRHRARCRLHARRTADKQIVFERIAQPVQRVADRRLAEAEPCPGAGHAALFDQRVENPQQVQVEAIRMNRIHGCDAILSFAQRWLSPSNDSLERFDSTGDGSMTSMVKSTVLSLGLVAGFAMAAQAQSVSSLPPGGEAPAQTAVTQPYGSTQSFLPKPGGGSVWKEEHYQPPADYASNPADHPYSTSIGPKPGSHSSGVDRHYQASDWDNQRAEHPYTAPGVGPKPN